MQEQMSHAERRALRPLQMIVAALIVGVITFTIVALAVGGMQSGPGQAPAPAQAGSLSMANTLRLVCAALIAGTLMVFPIVRRGQIGVLSRQTSGGDADDRARLMQAFTATTIIGGALAEGPALFGAVILLLTGELQDLILIAVPLLVLLFRFPTAGRWESFVRGIQVQRSLRRPD